MTNNVVIWDIDGTIVEGSLERCLLRYLRKSGNINPGQIASDAISRSIQCIPVKWFQLKLVYLCRSTVAEVNSWIGKCWDTEIIAKIRATCSGVVRLLNEQDVQQVILSGTPRPLAEPLADFLEIPDIIAAEPEIQNGRYTGGLVTPQPKGIRKKMMAEAWLREHGYRWDQSCAIANQWEDRFLLESVKTPIVVHPDKLLRWLAERRNWRIVDGVEDPASLASYITHNE